MRLTKMLVEDSIDEVLPKIEEESQLKCNTGNLKVELFNFKGYNEETSRIKNYVIYFLDLAYYAHQENKLRIKEFFPGNIDSLKISIGHELVHNAQFKNFPSLYKKSIEDFQNLGYLFEGDATLIEQNLVKKYYPKSKDNKVLISNLFYRIFFPDEEDYYGRGEEILREKFNNGKNRKGINKLYKKTPKEIFKIFEINNH